VRNAPQRNENGNLWDRGAIQKKNDFKRGGFAKTTFDRRLQEKKRRVWTKNWFRSRKVPAAGLEGKKAARREQMGGKFRGLCQ